MPTSQKQRFTAQEYLAQERAAFDSKSEYVRGHIRPMGGASLDHNQIVVNLAHEIGTQIRGGPCRAFVSRMRVKVPRTETYIYPDMVIVCGKPALEDEHSDTLMNPAVIIEVLSPSTERYDRGEKWAHYRQLESLRSYVLISQDSARVETFVRQGEQWLFSEVSGEGVLHMDTAGCSVPLEAIYEQVDFGTRSARPAT